DEDAVQASLFVPMADTERRRRIMEAVDTINRGENTHDAVHVGSYTPLSAFVRHERDSSKQAPSVIQILRPF
ncbi:MAG: hypothetical protein K2F72_01060, partial [Muribaculaceae bacterium]|nr:hypothetical protein [Muribaculaceae bacterium]